MDGLHDVDPGQEVIKSLILEAGTGTAEAEEGCQPLLGQTGALRGQLTAEDSEVVQMIRVQLVIDHGAEDRDHEAVLVLLPLVQVPHHQGIHFPVLGVLDVHLEHVHELIVDGVGCQVLNWQVWVRIVGKQTLQTLILLLGRLIDAPEGGEGGDKVVEVAHDVPLRTVAVKVGKRSSSSTRLVSWTFL